MDVAYFAKRTAVLTGDERCTVLFQRKALRIHVHWEGDCDRLPEGSGGKGRVRVCVRACAIRRRGRAVRGVNQHTSRRRVGQS